MVLVFGSRSTRLPHSRSGRVSRRTNLPGSTRLKMDLVPSPFGMLNAGTRHDYHFSTSTLAQGNAPMGNVWQHQSSAQRIRQDARLYRPGILDSEVILDGGMRFVTGLFSGTNPWVKDHSSRGDNSCPLGASDQANTDWLHPDRWK